MRGMSREWWLDGSSCLLVPWAAMGVVGVLVVAAALFCHYRQRLWCRGRSGSISVTSPGSAPRGRLLPPGSRGVPLLGETLRLIGAYKTANPEPFIDSRVSRHGSRVFTTHLFGETTVFSADPDVNRLVVQGEGRTFESSYPSSVATLLGRHSLVLTKGAAHRRLHSLVLGAFANKGTLREVLLPDVDGMVRRRLEGWWWKGGGERVLRLMDEAKKITFELAVKQLMSEEPGEWTEGLRRQYLAVIDGFFSLPVSFLPFSTYRRALKARAKVAEQIRAVVRRRRHELWMMTVSEEEGEREGEAKRESDAAGGKRAAAAAGKVGVGGGRCRDVLDALLVMGEEENRNNNDDEEDGGGSSRRKKKTDAGLEEEVVDFLLALLIAGYETTPTIMTVLVKLVTECPRALGLLKEEHEAIRSRKQDDLAPLEWSDYKTSMPFTQCVINETLRLANIISGVFRRATMDVPIKGGYTIPKGCKVFASFRGVHLDEEFHRDARTFNPWRWAQQQQQDPAASAADEQSQPQPQQVEVVKPQQQAAPVFTPFGGGPRMCPGYELGRLEISVFLHYLVTTYTWEPAEEDTLVHFPTARLLKSYPVRLLRRHRNLV